MKFTEFFTCFSWYQVIKCHKAHIKPTCQAVMMCDILPLMAPFSKEQSTDGIFMTEFLGGWGKGTDGFSVGKRYVGITRKIGQWGWWTTTKTLWWFFLRVCEVEHGPVEIVDDYPLIAWWIFPVRFLYIYQAGYIWENSRNRGWWSSKYLRIVSQ